MQQRKVKEKTFAFAALLFQKSADCISLLSELLKGNKTIEIKVASKKKER